MGFKKDWKKFKNHLKDGGLFYAFRRGVQYFLFLFRKKVSPRNIEISSPRLPVPDHVSFSKGNIKFAYDQGAGFSIFWKDLELTQKPGFSCGIHTLGFSTDSSLADTEILEKTDDFVKIKVSFQELPISQIWSVRMGEEGIFFWDIDVEAKEWLYIEEFRIVSLVGYGYKSWVSGHIQQDFKRVDDQWHDLFIGDRPFDLVAVRFPLGDSFRPSFSMELLDQQEYFSSIIQNPPLSHSAHIIGFRKLIPADARQIPPGFSHLFSGRITISEKDYFLDTRIEKLRQCELNGIFAKNKAGNTAVFEK
ncbi:MAG: hypothetical protein HZB36_05040 [Candidatus Omnitrophica bacterium]|nr:hypothetical protein [Candidatus Omnitrophota bacterium]